MLQNFRAIILLFIVTSLFSNDTDIDQYIRSGGSVDLTQGTKVTNMPYGYFIGQFGKSSIKGYDKINLLAYEDKKLLIGFGVYDIKEENCRYLDIPSNSTFDIAFDKRFTIGNDTYGLSRDKVTYSQCLSKAAQYSGFIFTPRDISEMSTVLRYFGHDKDMWMGYSKENCDSQYKNDENFEQSYENFMYPAEICTDTNRFTYSPLNTSQWLRVDQVDEYYCPIKINSPDYRRPIKFCMPWWRVERQWRLNANDEIFEFNGVSYDFRYIQYIIDYPRDEVICSAIDINSTNNTEEVSFDITCNSYDSIKVSPVCIDDINQNICHVDECVGYIKNTCVKKDSFTPFKDYDVGYILIDGIETRVKVKENKQTHSYNCPPPPKSFDKCLQKEEVTVFPAHCPSSKCDELSSCLQDKSNTFDECIEAFPCEKNYGTTDNIIRDANGEATALGGVCKDGSKIEARIEFKSRTKKTCLEYNQFIQTTENYKKCTSYSARSDKIVSTSITSNDEYKLDERCIRTNNIEEARPSVKAVFDYTTKGFFNTTIMKAYIDGTDENNEVNATVEYMLAASNTKLKPFTRAIDNTPIEDLSGKEFCEATFSTKWMEDRYYNLGGPNNLSSIVGYLHQENTTSVEKCRDNATLSNNRCEYNTPACGTSTYQLSDDTCRDTTDNIVVFACSDYKFRDGNTCYEDKWYNYPIIAVSSNKSSCDSYKSILGFVEDTNGSVFFDDYDFASLGISQTQINNKDFCIVGGNKIFGDDIFSSIKSNSEDLYYSSANNSDNETCQSYAKCIAGDVTTNYSSNSESGTCVIHVSDNTGLSEDGNVSSINTYSVPEIIKLEDIEGTFVGNINGYSDIFAVQEYTEGDFGYMSNYITKLPKNNIVKLDQREISPIIEQTPIQYSLEYDYSQSQNTQLTKNRTPDSHSADVSGFSAATTAIGDGIFGNSFADLTLQIGLAPVMIIFGKKQNWGWYDSHYKIYQFMDSEDKYVENLYGYDPRIIENGVLVHDMETLKSGTMKEGDYSIFRSGIIENKKVRFEFMGYSEEMINERMISPNEKTKLGWAGAKWYELSVKKTNHSMETEYNNEISKPISTIFMGAVNMVSIVVPYKGEYELKAYDKNDNLLATKIIEEQNFISNTPATSGNIAQTYVKVQLATANDFNVAPGHNKNLTNGSCISSNFVEWGGGVSGAYYEKGVPDIGLGSDCLKSNDSYVKAHSATKLTLRATNTAIVFVVKLKKPMPYPNRIVLVNLMQLENRKYECWSDVLPCTVSSEHNATE